MDFDTYFLVLLKAVPERAALSRAEVAEIQEAHLAHLSKMAQAGYMLVAGPFEVSADYPLRGICLYRGDLAKETVMELASADPAVQAGRLAVEVLKWYTEKDGLAFPNIDNPTIDKPA